MEKWASEIPITDARTRTKFKDGGKTPAWQRSEGKDPKGGLNQKGVESYRKEILVLNYKLLLPLNHQNLKKAVKMQKEENLFVLEWKV